MLSLKVLRFFFSPKRSPATVIGAYSSLLQEMLTPSLKAWRRCCVVEALPEHRWLPLHPCTQGLLTHRRTLGSGRVPLQQTGLTWPLGGPWLELGLKPQPHSNICVPSWPDFLLPPRKRPRQTLSRGCQKHVGDLTGWGARPSSTPRSPEGSSQRPTKDRPCSKQTVQRGTQQDTGRHLLVKTHPGALLPVPTHGSTRALAPPSLSSPSRHQVHVPPAL